MDKIKICYTQRANIGDSINPFIYSRVLGVDFEHADAASCDMIGIGSGLGRIFISPKNYKKFSMLFKGHRNHKPVILWSAGFLSTPSGREWKVRRHFKVAAVRGELSRKALEKITGKKIECVTGDAGILADGIISSLPEKKYYVGIIPHDNDREDPIIEKIKQSVENSVVIDVRGEVEETLSLIASCDTIISSSLHGLIIADGFHIPNIQMVVSDRLAGDGFKFHDYYSSYGKEGFCLDVREEGNIGKISSDFIKENYKLSFDEIDEKKKELKEAFFKFL